jgi:xanthine dehydrogenase YagT iron-sulfur-binding subunit
MEKKPPKKRKTYTRRAFLKGLGGGAAGTALATQFLSQPLLSSQTGIPAVPVYSKKAVTFTLNGKTISLEVEPRDTLLEVLRDKLKLTGTKRTCDRGECGGCTVLLDGQPVYSCLFLAYCADGKQITTIEGLAEGEKLHPVQQAFIEKDAYQCGYCMPGFIMSSVALLRQNPAPSLAEIKAGISGNFCRCGNYAKIYEAVAAASQYLRKA